MFSKDKHFRNLLWCSPSSSQRSNVGDLTDKYNPLWLYYLNTFHIVVFLFWIALQWALTLHAYLKWKWDDVILENHTILVDEPNKFPIGQSSTRTPSDWLNSCTVFTIRALTESIHLHVPFEGDVLKYGKTKYIVDAAFRHGVLQFQYLFAPPCFYLFRFLFLYSYFLFSYIFYPYILT